MVITLVFNSQVKSKTTEKLLLGMCITHNWTNKLDMTLFKKETNTNLYVN